MPKPVNPTKAYIIRLDGLRRLEKLLEELPVPTYLIYDFPQEASSFEDDHYQPLLLAGDFARMRDIRYLYSGEHDRWYYAVDSWRNDRGDDAGQVAGELSLWWAESLADDITKRPGSPSA